MFNSNASENAWDWNHISIQYNSTMWTAKTYSLSSPRVSKNYLPLSGISIYMSVGLESEENGFEPLLEVLQNIS